MIAPRLLIDDQKISGVIFSALDLLRRELLHKQIFELEATYCGIPIIMLMHPNI
jgi:hypothetical protein